MDNKLPEGWERKKLGEISKIKAGGTPSRGKMDYWNDGTIPWVKITDMKEKFISSTSEFITEAGLKNSSAKIIPKGTILISIFASLGEVGILDIEAACNQAIAGVQICDENVDKIYLYYYLKSKKSYFLNIGRGVAQNNINQKILKETEILVPPLKAQQKIVSILEKVEETKKLRAQADELTQKLLHSVFLEMFGDTLINENNWSLKKAEGICSKEKNAIKAGPFGSSLKKEIYVKKGYKIYGQEQVIKDDLAFGNYYISQEKYDELKNYRIQEGDVLISLVGSYGKISIIPHEFEHGIINPRLMKMTLNQEVILPIYFKHLFLSKEIMTQVSNLSHGGTMDIINVGIIKKLSFPVPPLPLQQKFAEICNQIEKTINSQQQSSFEINNLFDALMQKAFTGEIV